MQRFEDFQRIKHAAHPQVVGDTSVDQMEVGTVRAVAIGLETPERSYCACRERRQGTPEFDLPDEDAVYAPSLETCRRPTASR